MMQAASASRCFQPPDSVPASWSRREVSPRSSSVRSTYSSAGFSSIEPRHELQVLGDRQILVEREFLRHVADFALDLQALGPDVVAEHLARAFVGRQQAAHDADGRRLAGAVRPEEADDLAFGDVHRHMVDDGLGAEALDEAGDLDGVHRIGRYFPAARPTSTICPGCSGERFAFRPGFDQEDQLLPRLQRIDHRRREFGIRRDIADARRQSRLAAVAMDVEQAADRHRGKALLRQIEPELHGAVRQHRQHRRRRARRDRRDCG